MPCNVFNRLQLPQFPKITRFFPKLHTQLHTLHTFRYAPSYRYNTTAEDTMASIFQNGKFWRAQIRRKGYPIMTMTFDTKLEAQRWAVEKETEIGRNSPEQVRQRIENRQFTLNDALDRYEKEVLPGKSPSAKRTEPSMIRGLRQALGTLPLVDVTGGQLTSAIRRWQNECEWGANHIRLHLALLSFLYGVARKEWDMPELINPVPLVRKPRLPKGRDRRLAGDEESRLLRECESIDPELADIVRFAIETAMRQGEIMDMTWEHVYLDRHIVFLPRTKDPKIIESRTVPLSEAAEECLVRQRERLHNSDRNISQRVWRIQVEQLKYAYATAKRRAGITGLTFHDLRHEATSRLAEKGLPIMTLQAITGHKSMQMLKRYTHISPSALVSALRG